MLFQRGGIYEKRNGTHRRRPGGDAGRRQARGWFGGLAVIKLAGKDTAGQFSLLEMLYPPNYEVPLHVHHREEAVYYVLEGEMTVHIGSDTSIGGPGSVIDIPNDTPHRFTVTSPGPVKYLLRLSPAGFESFIIRASEPARSLTLPPPLDVLPDFEKLNAIMAEEYGTESLV